MTDDKDLDEFARIFRCTLDMAPVYVSRIHERMGRETPMKSILAVMKKIAPKRLSMDTIVEQLKKMDSGPARSRAATPSASGDEAAVEPAEAQADGAARPKPRTPRKTPPGAQASPVTQIGRILTANWERGRKQGLKTPALTADKFVQRAQSLTGTPKPTVARVLEAIRKLDRRDVLLTPSLVADEINESDEE
jgi:hypothetical protein